jgi:hypothetical protein
MCSGAVAQNSHRHPVRRSLLGSPRTGAGICRIHPLLEQHQRRFGTACADSGAGPAARPGPGGSEADPTAPRYSEPKLVKLMEQKGIGRPSTYAPTIKTLRQREYVELLQGKLQPTALGLELDGALEKLLPDLIQPEFTAQMETAWMRSLLASRNGRRT